MESSTTRVLVVANRTAATPRLLEEVKRRSKQSSCEFTLLIRDAPSRKAAAWTLENALPLLRRAARGPVEALVDGQDPVTSVQDAVHAGNFDEVIVSTLPPGMSKMASPRSREPGQAAGLPVTAIIPGDGKVSNREAAKMLTELGPGAGLGG